MIPIRTAEQRREHQRNKSRRQYLSSELRYLNREFCSSIHEPLIEEHRREFCKLFDYENFHLQDLLPTEDEKSELKNSNLSAFLSEDSDWIILYNRLLKEKKPYFSILQNILNTILNNTALVTERFKIYTLCYIYLRMCYHAILCCEIWKFQKENKDAKQTERSE